MKKKKRKAQPLPDPGQMKEALERSAETEQHCVLCTALTRNRGMFIPDEEHILKYRAKPKAGKCGVLIYALCPECMDLPDEERNQRVEDEIVRRRLSVS